MKTFACLALLPAAVFMAHMASAPAAQAVSEPAAQRTVVRDAAALARLRRNSGMTLQWISFESPARGRVHVTEREGFVHLRGSQSGNGGELTLDGDVLSIDRTSFTFRGEISIVDTPDPGRNCLRDGVFEFRVTQRRRYWRLQQMEACDGLTDYVDIYF
jgi:hypothetical protein